MTKNNDCTTEAETELNSVMTITEVSEEFKITIEGVRWNCREGRIPARQSGATWLIRRKDAAKLWKKR